MREFWRVTRWYFAAAVLYLVLAAGIWYVFRTPEVPG